jgi:hypothetical protein
MRGLKLQFSLRRLLLSIAFVAFGTGIIARWMNGPAINSPALLFAGWLASGALIGGGLFLLISPRAASIGAAAGAIIQCRILLSMLSGL